MVPRRPSTCVLKPRCTSRALASEIKAICDENTWQNNQAFEDATPARAELVTVAPTCGLREFIRIHIGATRRSDSSSKRRTEDSQHGTAPSNFARLCYLPVHHGPFNNPDQQSQWTPSLHSAIVKCGNSEQRNHCTPLNRPALAKVPSVSCLVEMSVQRSRKDAPPLPALRKRGSEQVACDIVRSPAFGRRGSF